MRKEKDTTVVDKAWYSLRQHRRIEILAQAGIKDIPQNAEDFTLYTDRAKHFGPKKNRVSFSSLPTDSRDDISDRGEIFLNNTKLDRISGQSFGVKHSLPDRV